MLAKELLKEFVFECQVRKLSPKTIKSYKNNTLYFLTYLEEEFHIKNANEITHLHIKSFLMYLHKNNRKVSYTNGLIKVFRAYFKYFKERRFCLKLNFLMNG